ncbi:MAG TPA: hypothetical protein VHB74_16305 [Devosia sp.]|nr:hypothetical protein [Devosia sp.]
MNVALAGPPASASRRRAALTGYWASIVAAVGVAAYGLVQILQVMGGVANIPGDSLIYGTSLLIAPPFLLAMLALDYLAPEERKFYGHGAVSFATLYAGFALLIYVVQLGSVLPMAAAGAAPSVLQVTPHSLFWTVDALAYIAMGTAAFFAAFIFDWQGGGRAVRLALVAHGLMTPVIAVVYFYPVFSLPLLILGSPWLVTALATTVLLAREFGRTVRAA